MTPQELERLREAFSRGADFTEDLAEAFYLAKARVYEDTLAELADQYGYDVGDIPLSDSILDALQQEADRHAESVTATHNAELDTLLGSRDIQEMTYEQAVDAIAAWADERDARRADMISLTELYGPHADATMAFFLDQGLEPQFDFGGHGDPHPICEICEVLLASNPHPLSRVIAIGTPHPQCRQSWHPRFDARDLPEELSLGQGDVAGIVGGETLIQRVGGLREAVAEIERLM